ncbi:ester cyclase [Actinokineospora bangkokensis]|uniref:Polyketide cyclase n=1 Tax=Actinokineospora bangkokensis TaxID=1193682 RepID=A0A1Q9LN74_9PSEU|nr:nuclear transport factor 2 family protein [Actinokineospora bangkokensis]OLR93492.1 polyketide cyclase [Actinokineospora bangkokensis]
MAATPAHDLYRRWLADLWNGDASAARDLVSADFVGHWPTREVRGPDELAAVVAKTHGLFDALDFTLEVGPLVEDDLVCARWSGRGYTSDGELTFHGNDLLRVRDGRFVEYWTGTSSGS